SISLSMPEGVQGLYSAIRISCSGKNVIFAFFTEVLCICPTHPSVRFHVSILERCVFPCCSVVAADFYLAYLSCPSPGNSSDLLFSSFERISVHRLLNCTTNI